MVVHFKLGDTNYDQACFFLQMASEEIVFHYIIQTDYLKNSQLYVTAGL